MKPTTDEVLKWAMESGMDDGVSDLSYPLSMFEKFSALAFAAGAAAMKERAAKVCEEIAALYSTDIFPEDGTSIDCNSAKMGRVVTKNCAAAIRALGDDDE